MKLEKRHISPEATASDESYELFMYKFEDGDKYEEMVEYIKEQHPGHKIAIANGYMTVTIVHKGRQTLASKKK
jgi:hypothetical protein